MPEIELESHLGGYTAHSGGNVIASSLEVRFSQKHSQHEYLGLADIPRPSLPFRRGVQKKGCHALVNIMSNNEKNVATVARLGGCSAAVAAIRAHRDVGVHAQAIAALVSLSAERYFFLPA